MDICGEQEPLWDRDQARLEGALVQGEERAGGLRQRRGHGFWTMGLRFETHSTLTNCESQAVTELLFASVSSSVCRDNKTTLSSSCDKLMVQCLAHNRC